MQDIFDGGAGNDTVDYSAFSSNLTFNLSLAPDANGYRTVVGSATTAASYDLFKNVEGFIGGTGSDTITGDTNANALSGGGGNDIIFATVDDVADTIDGGTGIDTVDYSAYAAALTVALNGSTAATVFGSGSTAGTSDTVANIENFKSGFGADTIVGDLNNNTYIAVVDNAQDLFDGGAGNDTADYSAFSSNLTLDLTLPPDSNGYWTVTGSADTPANYDLVKNVESFKGGTGIDTFTGDGFNNTYVAVVDNVQDVFDGGGGSDTAGLLCVRQISRSRSTCNSEQRINRDRVAAGTNADSSERRKFHRRFSGNDTFPRAMPATTTFTGGGGTDQIIYRERNGTHYGQSGGR